MALTKASIRSSCIPTIYVLDVVRGYGGKFGVEKDRQDASAAGWDYQEKMASHESQTGWKICLLLYLKTFGSNEFQISKQ